MAKRKTGALRTQDSRAINSRETQTFYMNQSKTIKFEGAKPKQHKRLAELIPKSLNQEKFILALLNKEVDIVVVGGPAGTGKTYLAMQAALKSLQNREISKILICRPAVSIENESHGFLPGNLAEKLSPWVRPALDVIKEYYSVQEVERMIADEIIEFAPLGMMRGRTIKNTFLICDESQNSSPLQLQSLLTRIGIDSKFVITGDIEQADRSDNNNGLMDLLRRIKDNPIKGVEVCQLDNRDIQRHRLVGEFINIYRK